MRVRVMRMMMSGMIGGLGDGLEKVFFTLLMVGACSALFPLSFASLIPSCYHCFFISHI